MRLNWNTWYSFGNATNWVIERCINLETTGLFVESNTCLMLTLLTVRVRLVNTRTLNPLVHTTLSCCTAWRVSAVALYKFIRLLSILSIRTVCPVFGDSISVETE